MNESKNNINFLNEQRTILLYSDRVRQNSYNDDFNDRRLRESDEIGNRNRFEENLRNREYENHVLMEQTIKRQSFYDDDSRHRNSNSYDLNSERRLWERRRDIYNDDLQDQQRRRSIDRNLNDDRLIYEQRRSMRDDDSQNKYFDERYAREDFHSLQDRRILNEFDKSSKFLDEQNVSRRHFDDRLESNFRDKYFRDDKIADDRIFDKRMEQNFSDEYLRNKYSNIHDVDKETFGGYLCDKYSNKEDFNRDRIADRFKDRIAENFHIDSQSNHGTNFRNEYLIDQDINSSQGKFTNKWDIEERHVKEYGDQNESVRRLPHRDSPSATYDLVKRNFSDAPSKCYKEFSADDVEQYETRKEVINNNSNNLFEQPLIEPAITPENDKHGISKYFRKRGCPKDSDLNQPVRVSVSRAQRDGKTLTKLELVQIEDAIIEEVVKGSYMKPSFEGIYYRAGALVIDCVNEATVNWLETIVPKLSNWKGVPLAVKRDNNLVMEVILPKSAGYNSRKCVALLNAQNEGLHIKKWKIWKNKSMGDNQVLVIGIDSYSADNIISQNNILDYKFGKVSVTGLTSDTPRKKRKSSMF